MEMISPAVATALQKTETKNAHKEHEHHYFCFRRGQDKTSKVGTSIHDLYSPIGATSVHRARYLDELIKEVPDEVASFGKRLDRIRDEGDHVVLHFQVSDPLKGFIHWSAF